MTDYGRFEGDAWEKFGKELLRKKGSEKQKEFLRVCRSGKDDFLAYVDEYFSSAHDIIDGTPVSFERKFQKFTESQFLYPPEDTQQIIWDVFKGIPEEMKHDCGFWGYTIVAMLRCDCIEPDYLAARLNGTKEKGIDVLDKALKTQDEKTIDDCVRRVLRSMCNPEPRGKRIVFHDFHLGKAYWRWHWADRMSKHIKLDFKEILKTLDREYYAAFSAKMHTRKSYISAENTLGGLLLFLRQHETAKKKITGKKLEKVIDQISYLSAWKAIEVQEPSVNQKEIQEISKKIIKEDE